MLSVCDRLPVPWVICYQLFQGLLPHFHIQSQEAVPLIGKAAVQGARAVPFHHANSLIQMISLP